MAKRIWLSNFPNAGQAKFLTNLAGARPNPARLLRKLRCVQVGVHPPFVIVASAALGFCLSLSCLICGVLGPPLPFTSHINLALLGCDPLFV